MKSEIIAGHKVKVHHYESLIVGAGAAGMNCAVHLYEFMMQRGVVSAQDKIAVITRGVLLGASRMSGSDKQTYYKMGTSPDVADSAEAFAASLTAGGCCHEDLALIEGVSSLREFYHLARIGVEFPHDEMGTYVGYKTDHDPYERATSAGPKTSKQMSECLQCEVEQYGIEIYDRQEVAELLTVGEGDHKKIIGVACVDIATVQDGDFEVNVFLCDNLILATGGPGDMYKTTVYPAGQIGIHGIALKAGLIAENLSESQFGLASIKFRWNVSGTYMQAIPNLFSTDSAGNDKCNFLIDAFPDMKKMATAIFLKGYQWPFDAQRIDDFQSSLIDMLVFKETQNGRRVFMDFLHNPVAGDSMKSFYVDGMEKEAVEYLRNAGATQERPIDRLAHMNPLAIDIYAEHGIDLCTTPLEIAVCAQHNNGGFAVNKWWESNIKHTFIIGEMAGSHGVKRPGGAALNAGQVGGLRAAEYIANVYSGGKMSSNECAAEALRQVNNLIIKLVGYTKSEIGLDAKSVLKNIRQRMTYSCGHIRKIDVLKKSLDEALELYEKIKEYGLVVENDIGLVNAIHAESLSLASIAYIKSILELRECGGGSRGSYLVLSDNGEPIPENIQLRDSIICVKHAAEDAGLFKCNTIPVRRVSNKTKTFESVWADYRAGKYF